MTDSSIQCHCPIVHCRSGPPLLLFLWLWHRHYILAQCNWCRPLTCATNCADWRTAPFGSHWVKGVRPMIKTCSGLFGACSSPNLGFWAPQMEAASDLIPAVCFAARAWWVLGAADLTQMCWQRCVRCTLSTQPRLQNDRALLNLELVPSTKTKNQKPPDSSTSFHTVQITSSR